MTDWLMIGRKKLDLINYAKGLSIFAIVLFHLIAYYSNAPEILKTASFFGGAGVHVFIICSGFGLALSYFNKQVTYLEFLKKRMAKIYIPYIIVVLFCALFYNFKNELIALCSHIFLFKMFIPEFEDSFGMHFWYISTLFQLYFIFIPLMKLEKRVGAKRLFLLSCTISVLWIIFTIIFNLTEIRIWNSFFLQFLWEFSLGICLAKKFNDDGIEMDSNIKTPYLAIITCISLPIFALLALKGGILKSLNDIFSVCAFGGVVLLIYRFKILKKLFFKINTFSYELYLLHILSFDIVFLIFENVLPNIIVCIIALICSIGVAVFYHYLINFFKKLPKNTPKIP